jgi:hypothetical protein
LAKDSPPRASQDELAREIDRLVKQLPGADPHLKGTPLFTPAQPAPRGPTTASPAGGSPTASAEAPVPPLSVWLRVALGAVLGAAVLLWPYPKACGWALDGFLAVIAIVLVAGGWATVWSWRAKMAVAHVVSLVVLAWGLALGAAQVLPRVGYAVRTATWFCPQ